MDKIAIIGGSGFIGTELIDQLKYSYQIQNFDKKESSITEIVTEIVDVRDKKSLNKLSSDTYLVILLAAEHTDNVSPISLYYDVNVTGTKNVLEVMDEKGIKNIIFTSTVAIYGLNKENPTEDCPADPFNDYGKSKWEAENILRGWYDNDREGKSLFIIRPTVVFGEKNRGNVFNLLKQIKSGKFMMIGRGYNKKSMSYIENIIAFIKFIIDQKPVDYQVYNYADKPDLTTMELINIIFEKVNKTKRPLRIPYVVGYLGGLAFDICSGVTGKKFSVSRVRVKKFCATTQFSAEKVISTGFIPPFSLKQGLEKTIETI